jgi:CubicO group peptidase (beta-lactamase class C family)
LSHGWVSFRKKTQPVSASVSAELHCTLEALPLRGNETTRKVDDLFAPWSARRSPGCSVGVLRNGEFLLRRGYGSADLAHRIPIGPDTVFYMASMSKQFTAASIGLLITQGKLSLEDDVRIKYVPELPDYGDRILVRDLVYHTSGIRDYISLTEDLTDFHTAATPTTATTWTCWFAKED